MIIEIANLEVAAIGNAVCHSSVIWLVDFLLIQGIRCVQSEELYFKALVHLLVRAFSRY